MKIIKVEHCGVCPYGPNKAASCGWAKPFMDGFPENCMIDDDDDELLKYRDYCKKLGMDFSKQKEK